MHIEFDILTLFPEMVEGFLSASMLARARQNGLINIKSHQLRDWATDRHQKTDELPFGGGPGMVMKPEPIYAAADSLRNSETKFIYMAPDGEPLTSQLARELAQETHLILLSGHYEGVDQRVRTSTLIRSSRSPYEGTVSVRGHC